MKKLLNFWNFVNIKVGKSKLDHLGFYCKLYFFDRTIRKIRNWNRNWVLIDGTPCIYPVMKCHNGLKTFIKPKLYFFFCSLTWRSFINFFICDKNEGRNKYYFEKSLESNKKSKCNLKKRHQQQFFFRNQSCRAQDFFSHTQDSELSYNSN